MPSYRMTWVDGVRTKVELTPEEITVGTVQAVPTEVTKLQLVRGMRATGDWSSFKSSLKQSSTTIKEDWEYASVIDRYDSIVVAMGATLSLDTAGMDSLFITASTL